MNHNHIEIEISPTRWESEEQLVAVYNEIIEKGGCARDVLFYYYPELEGNFKSHHRKSSGAKLYHHLHKVITGARKKGLVTHYHGISPDVKATMLRLYNAGYTIKRIASHTGLDESRVSYFLVQNYRAVNQDGYPPKLEKKQRYYNAITRRERGG